MKTTRHEEIMELMATDPDAVADMLVALEMEREIARLRIESRDALQSLVDAIGGIDSSTWLPTEVCEAYERAKDILANTEITRSPGASNGSALFARVMIGADEDKDRERGELMHKVWNPTPWMLDVFDGGPGPDGREREIRNWLNRHFGRESSPIHGHEGLWHQGNVTMHGRTWYGFATEEMMTRFAAAFCEPNKGITPRHD
jgi:hypothetical protein